MDTTILLFHVSRIRQYLATIVLGLCLAANLAVADPYSDARAELIAAYQAQDFGLMQTAAEAALEARPGYPGALFNLAFARVLRGDNEGSLAILTSLIESGVDFGVADIEEFTALQQLPGWPVYANAVEALRQPVGEVSVAYTYHVGDFIPEGIAVAGDRLFLGSIRHGWIARIDEHADVVSNAETSDHWSVFGMRFGPEGELWFASAAVPEYAAVDDESRGQTGLFRLNLDTGKITQRVLLPKGDQPMVLGDLVFADDDTIYATESLTGALFRYTISSGGMTQVIAPGSMRSMQGLVLDESGQYLYVADYVGGLFRVRLSDYSIGRVRSAKSTSLFGIDGLYRHGNELIAIQNGIRPNRVIAFELGADGISVTGSRILARNLADFDEPTLGTIVGDDFLFVANSHWNRFDRDANLPEDLTGPVILKISLKK